MHDPTDESQDARGPGSAASSTASAEQGLELEPTESCLTPIGEQARHRRTGVILDQGVQVASRKARP